MSVGVSHGVSTCPTGWSCPGDTVTPPTPDHDGADVTIELYYPVKDLEGNDENAP